MAGLLSLPVELLLQILDELGSSRNHLCALRVVCRQLNLTIDPQFHSYLVLDIRKHRLEIAKSQLEDLATGRTRACEFVRKLKIVRLAPSYDPFAPAWPVNSDDATGLESEVMLAIKHMRKYLALAIMSLKNLRRIIWTINEKDPEWIGQSVVKGLASLPLVEDFELTLSSGSHVPVPLSQLVGLRRIVFTGHGDTDCQNTVKQLGKAIANSPQLSHLEVMSNLPDDDAPTLHDLFAKLNPRKPLPLTHLGLRGWCTRLDTITLPHLKSLESFSIALNPHPHTRNASRFRSMFGHAPRTFSSEYHEIWKSLQEECIYPIRIHSDVIDGAFLKYLVSHSGLKELGLHRTTHISWAESSTLANKFYQLVLPKLLGSLEKLTIRANFEGDWCFRRHNGSILSQAWKLTHLAVTLHSGDILPRDIRDENSSVELLLRTAAELPHLRELSVLLPAYSNNSLEGIGASHTRAVAMDAVDRNIKAFTPTNPHANFPVVRSGKHFYEMKAHEGGSGDARYRRTSTTRWSAFDVLFFYGPGHLNTNALVQLELWPYVSGTLT